MAHATSGQKPDVSHFANVRVSGQSCTFCLNPRLKMCGVDPNSTSSLKPRFRENLPTCNVSNKDELLSATKILELFVMQDNLLNIDS